MSFTKTKVKNAETKFVFGKSLSFYDPVGFTLHALNFKLKFTWKQAFVNIYT